MKQQITLKQEFLMEGAVTILSRYARHLEKHLNQAVQNYESADFEREVFLSDVDYAIDNAAVVRRAADTITSILTIMRAEVAPIFQTTNEKREENGTD